MSAAIVSCFYCLFDEQRQLRQHGRERRVIVTVDEEVVAQREQHVGVGLDREAPQQLREARLHVRWAQGEELLELIGDEQGLRVTRSPPRPRPRS